MAQQQEEEARCSHAIPMLKWGYRPSRHAPVARSSIKVPPCEGSITSQSSSNTWRPIMQIHEPMGDISHSSHHPGLLCRRYSIPDHLIYTVLSKGEGKMKNMEFNSPVSLFTERPGYKLVDYSPIPQLITALIM